MPSSNPEFVLWCGYLKIRAEFRFISPFPWKHSTTLFSQILVYVRVAKYVSNEPRLRVSQTKNLSACVVEKTRLRKCTGRQTIKKGTGIE